MVTKVCSKCGHAKPYDNFYWQMGQGLKSRCKRCSSEEVERWRFHQGVNRDAVALIETEAEVLAALTQPVPFYAPPPQN